MEDEEHGGTPETRKLLHLLSGGRIPDADHTVEAAGHERLAVASKEQRSKPNNRCTEILGAHRQPPQFLACACVPQQDHCLAVKPEGILMLDVTERGEEAAIRRQG